MILLVFRDLNHDKKHGWQRYPAKPGLMMQKPMVLPAAHGMPALYVRHIESIYVGQKVLIISQTEIELTEGMKQQLKDQAEEFIKHTNDFKYQYGDSLDCENCGYEYPDFDEENNICTCPNCGKVYAVDDYDPDYQEEQLDLGACCNCGKYDDTCTNLLAINKKCHIPGTGWGCVICGLPPDGALVILCGECIKHAQNGQLEKPTRIIHGFAMDKGRIDYNPDELEDFNHRDIPHDEQGSQYN